MGTPLWLLVLVTLSGTMAMHIFVPALPVAGSALHAPAASMQQTITLYVIGLALGQLVYGPDTHQFHHLPAQGVLVMQVQDTVWVAAQKLPKPWVGMISV